MTLLDARAPRLVLVLGHGAGGGIEAPDLQALAEALPSAGGTVVLVEQPWRVAGRRVASPPPTLDRDWLEVLSALRTQVLSPGVPLVLGGRSAGARVAARTAVQVRASGVLALAFPLVPPVGSRRSRVPELLPLQAAGVPLLVVQGERDPFGGPADFPAQLDVRGIPYADHSFAVPRSAPVTRKETMSHVAGLVTAWLEGVVRV